MNTNGLAKHYDQLTPWERVPLNLAAHRRGDTAEGDRLARSAPSHTFRVPDHYGLSEGLLMLAEAVRLEQLDLAAFYWHMETFVADFVAYPTGTENEERIERLENTQKFLAYRFLVFGDAWKLLCAELHLAPDAVARYLPGAETVAQMKSAARELAFTSGEALAYLHRNYEAADAAADQEANVRWVYDLQRAEDVAREWREYLDEHLEDWS
jgi:hypothetical protein